MIRRLGVSAVENLNMAQKIILESRTGRCVYQHFSGFEYNSTPTMTQAFYQILAQSPIQVPRGFCRRLHSLGLRCMEEILATPG